MTKRKKKVVETAVSPRRKYHKLPKDDKPIIEALRETGGVITQTAKILNVSHTAVDQRVKKSRYLSAVLAEIKRDKDREPELPESDDDRLYDVDTGSEVYLLAQGDDYERWLKTTFPAMFSTELAEHHHSFWRWASSIEPKKEAPALVAVWPRGGGKSTNVEVLPLYLFLHARRRYIWYISETQKQADDHVANIADILLTAGFEREVNKYGVSQGWRANRLKTASGLTVDAIGLDVAKRGSRMNEQRPDVMIFDDIDGEKDTIEASNKKEEAITKKLLPAGTKDTVYVFCQNLVIPHGIVSRLSNDTAKYIANRTVLGPIPAIEGLETETNKDGRTLIVDGRATWRGQDIPTCQTFIDTWGIDAFMSEAQHDVFNGVGAIYNWSWWDGRNRHRNDYEKIGRFLFADTGYKDKATNDPSAICVFDLLADYRIALAYMWEKRVLSNVIPDEITRIAEEFGGEREINGVIIEDKASGITAVQTLKANTTSWLSDVIVPFEPKGSKEYRAKLASVWCGRNCVLLPEVNEENMPWMSKFADKHVGQLFKFPNVRHDDMTDTFTMGIIYLEHYLSRRWAIINETNKQNIFKHSRVNEAMKGYTYQQ